MSTNNPGIIYDATNSWNGYNHQGKISLWYAISEITKLYDPTISENYKVVLDDYFLEIEHMEDFSIGKIENGTPSYISVHQVKNRVEKSIMSYESAILGLLAHLSEYPNIESAVLHTTEEVSLSGKLLLDHVKAFVQTPQYLIDAENEVNDNRDISTFRKELTTKKRGRPITLKTNLVNALKKKHSSSTELNDSNLDEAFNLYLEDIKAEKARFSSLSEEDLKKVSICAYTLNGITVNHCSVDCAVESLKTVIKDFYQKLYPGIYKTSNNYVHKSCLWLLGKLDDHIIERDLHYDLYKKNVSDRRIPFSIIFSWLTASDIDNHDSWYYLHYIKEGMFGKLERYCKGCSERNRKCSICNVVECKNKMGDLSFEDFKNFIHMTNPTVAGVLDMESFPRYLGNGISDPFAKGLRDIPKIFDSKHNAISYKDNESVQCALTTIAGEGSDNDNAIISSDILMNSNVYGLLMDYDHLISKDIAIDSIKSEQILQTPRFDGSDLEELDHIMHCKDVKIIPLNDFIKDLFRPEEDTAI